MCVCNVRNKRERERERKRFTTWLGALWQYHRIIWAFLHVSAAMLCIFLILGNILLPEANPFLYSESYCLQYIIRGVDNTEDFEESCPDCFYQITRQHHWGTEIKFLRFNNTPLSEIWMWPTLDFCTTLSIVMQIVKLCANVTPAITQKNIHTHPHTHLCVCPLSMEEVKGYIWGQRAFWGMVRRSWDPA